MISDCCDLGSCRLLLGTSGGFGLRLRLFGLWDHEKLMLNGF